MNETIINKFIELANLFSKSGFSLYLIGGSSRDYLLNREFKDLDLCSDATPDEIKNILPSWDYTYSRFGNVHYKNIDITTLRKEDEYIDFRHPNKIIFTKDIKEDYKRRDFTINAIYIDKDLKVYDFSNGSIDLKNKIIRFIGDPVSRVKEDPLRILRAERFAKVLGFTIEPNSLKAINDNRDLLNKLNKDKISQELRKIHL